MSLFNRVSDEPLLSLDDFSGSQAVFNPSPAKIGGEMILLVSVWYPDHPKNAQTYVGRSDDGLSFSFSEQPFIRLPSETEPRLREMDEHMIDNRVTPLEGWHYILTPACSVGGKWGKPYTVMGRTRDFRDYEFIDLIGHGPERGASLFPEKIGGYYWKVDRPGAGGGMGGMCWISRSPDLIHWGHHRPLLASGTTWWDQVKNGPTPPIRTDAGWLMILHGVNRGDDGHNIYRIGAALLDLEDPARVLGVTNDPLLTPELPWEKEGRVPNVVFPCGVLPEGDHLRLYYGAADTAIGLAEAQTADIVAACLTPDATMAQRVSIHA